MLTVVEVGAVDAHAPRAPAELARAFEHERLETGARQFNPGSEPGPAAADDDYAHAGWGRRRRSRQRARKAIQNLRAGVSNTL